MKKLGHPSQQDFEHYLRGNLIRNCPLTVDDAKRVVDIFGPGVHSLQGKTVKRKRDHVSTFIPIEILEQLEKSYKNDTLCNNNFYINGNVSFHTITRNMKLSTVTSVNSRKKIYF